MSAAAQRRSRPSAFFLVILWALVIGHWGFVQSALALSRSDHKFLDDLQRASFLFFWESADPQTGLVKDRSRADGQYAREVASVAATGFGLTALCIAHERKYAPRKDIEERVLNTLRFLWNELPHERGFYYNFVNYRTSERV